MKPITRVKIQVVVEISNESDYGGEWKLADLYEQAVREAMHRLRVIMKENGGSVVGEPKAIAVIQNRD